MRADYAVVVPFVHSTHTHGPTVSTAVADADGNGIVWLPAGHWRGGLAIFYQLVELEDEASARATPQETQAEDGQENPDTPDLLPLPMTPRSGQRNSSAGDEAK